MALLRSRFMPIREVALTKRKKIKARRKPKIVRDRSWRARVLRGEIDDELKVPQVERVLPRGQEEERVNLWTKIESELELEASTQTDEIVIPDGWFKGVVIRVSTGLYHVDLGEETIICSVRGSLSASETGYTNIVAVGDRVLVSSESLPDGVIERVLPRTTVLARPDVVNQDVSQIIVSNVDQLLIVSSWYEPDIWLELIDRALITAAEGKMKPLICINKIDLLDKVDRADCHEVVKIYQELGYTVLLTSAATGQGIDALRDCLVGHETALVGLSGVGKSSLLMAVQPDLKLKVTDVSDYSGQGRHTTTQVSLLKLDQGGYVVDTPGIRELGLIKVHRYELVLYFPEIEALVEQCRFNDCTHLHEPGCAVIEAVEDERIPWSRYASYQAIYESLPEYYTE
jgi:ribosome biogenesis GTPase